MNNKNLAVMETKEFTTPLGLKVRVVMIDGNPWFVGKDVAECLGYKDVNKAVAMHVMSEDKRLNDKTSPSFGQRGATLINESGLYSLVLSSKLETAKEFKHWVTSEVLPSIRRHGAYMTDETLEQALLSPDFLIKLATELKKEKEERQRLEGKVQEMTPKVNFATALLQDDNACITLGDYARHIAGLGYPVSVKTIHKLFRDKGWLLSSEKNWNKPTQEMITAGYLTSREKLIYCNDGYGRMGKIVIVPLITPKGQEYFMQKLGVL